MGRSIDDGFDVCVNELFGHLEFFTENVQLAVAAYEANDDDLPVGYMVEVRQLCGRRKQHSGTTKRRNLFQWRFAFKAAVAVEPIVKALEIFTLPFERRIAWEPLASVKLFVISAVKAFDKTVAPRLSDGDEHRRNVKVQA